MAKTETRRINIWINGNEVQNNIKDITAAYRKLINEQARMTVGSKEYMAHAAKIKQLKGVIDDHKRQIGSIATTWQKAKDTIVATGFGVLGGNMLTALTTRIGGFFSNIITGASKLSDQMADIRKTTGMTMEEVEGLSSSLSQIDTRTSTSDLRQMAIVAGQLGIATEDVLGFVEAVDKTAVALGDEFTGGAEEVASTVGKLRNVFTDIKTANIGDDILHISNALNELGAAGFATSPVVADFAGRIGGVGITLGLTTGQVLGLSATLQELNVSTERGGTAVVRILQKMTTETEKFAVIAGMDVTAFRDLVNTDLYGAFTKVMEGSKQSGNSATALAGIIKDLEVQGAGASEVFAKLGSNVTMMNEKVDLATKSLQSTDSVMEEFALKNDNFAGQWEKTKKVFAGVTMSIGQALAPALLSLGKGLADLIGWIRRNSAAVGAFLKIIAVGITAMISYKVAVKLAGTAFTHLRTQTIAQTVATKANNLISTISKGIYFLWSAAVALLSGNMKKATVSMRAFSIATKANPIGLLIGVVTAATAAFAFFNKKADESAEVMYEIEQATRERIQPLITLKEAVNNAALSDDEFAQVILEVNKQTGSAITLEKGREAAIKQANKAIEDRIRLLKLEAKAEVYGNRLKDATNKFITIQEDTYNKIRNYYLGNGGLSSVAAEYVTDLAAQLHTGEISMAQFNNSFSAMLKGYDSDIASFARYQLLGENSSFWSPIATTNSDEWKEAGKNVQDYADKLLAVQTASNNVNSTSVNVPETNIPDFTPGTVGTTENATKDVNEYLKVYEDLRGKIKDIFSKMRLDRLSDEEKELQQVRDKYDEMISMNQMAQIEIAAKGKGATDEELATAKALASQLIDLEALKQAELTAITDKYEKIRKEKRAEVGEQIRIALMTADEKEGYDITKKYQDLIKLAEEYGFDTVALYKKMQEELDALKNKGVADTDVLGMTPDDWDSIFDKLQMLGQALGYINDWAKNTEESYMQQLEADYEQQNTWLDQQFEKKRMNEETYNFLKEKYEKEYEAKKIEIQRRQVQREKDIKTFEAVISLAKNIVEAGVITPQAFLIAALGALQIAAIRSEPLPQMWTGGYTMKDSSNTKPAGTVHANEWVSPAWMVKDPVTGPMISQLEAIRSSGNARRSVSVPQQQRNVVQQSSADMSTSLLQTIASQNDQLLKYMSDPINRRAYMVHDEFTRYERDLANLQQLRKIS